jgi:hypothetical protein
MKDTKRIKPNTEKMVVWCLTTTDNKNDEETFPPEFFVFRTKEQAVQHLATIIEEIVCDTHGDVVAVNHSAACELLLCMKDMRPKGCDCCEWCNGIKDLGLMDLGLLDRPSCGCENCTALTVLELIDKGTVGPDASLTFKDDITEFELEECVKLFMMDGHYLEDKKFRKFNKPCMTWEIESRYI